MSSIQTCSKILAFLILASNAIAGHKVISSLTPVAGLRQLNPPLDFVLLTYGGNNVVSSSSSSVITVGNKMFNNYTTATIRSQYQTIISGIRNTTNRLPTATFSVSGSTATVDTNGFAQRNAMDGATSITCTLTANGKSLSQTIVRQFTQTGGNTQATFTAWAPGSLGAHLYAQIDALIAASGTANIGTLEKLFTLRTGTSSPYMRNGSCYISGTGIDFTGVSPWSGTQDSWPGGSRGAGTLVSPRHFIYANHFTLPNGTKLYFAKSDGTLVYRTITAQTNIAGTDIQVGVLDSDVPAGITFYKVMPSNWHQYASDYQMWPAPLLCTDQNKNVYLNETYYVSNNLSTFYEIAFNPCADPTRLLFTGGGIAGDSGSPIFFLINGQLVLVGCYYTFCSCPDIAYYATQINSAMTALGGGYQLTTVSLAGFISY